ncbi:MAG: nitrogen fixation protein NifX [Cyanobacteria bacterium P01_A01_bin.135]
MKIAFTTRDSKHINAHFGWAKQIDVYDANTEGYRFLETLTFGGDLKEDGNEDKLEPKVKALENCIIVYVSAIGGSAAARLIRKNITPIKAESETDEIEDVLARLVKTLNGSPPPWLRKALQKSQPRSFEDDLETTEEEVLV